MALSPSYCYGFNGGTFQFRKQELLHRLVARIEGDVPDVAAEGRLCVSLRERLSGWER